MEERKKFLIKLLDSMITIRSVEETLQNTFLEQKIFSFLHLMLGQEASPVGVAVALKNEDLMMGNHRSHGHYLAKGGSLEHMIKEVLGDLGGCCAGYGGSMHMIDRSVGFEGSTPILGSVSGLILGKGFKLKIENKKAVAVCFIGDGAAEEGLFYESVNLACSKKLPVMFIIEDNKYAVNSRHSDRKSKDYNFKSVFEGLGAYYSRVNGQDVEEVFNNTLLAREKTVKGKPSVLHLDVDRLHGHSGPVPEKTTGEYREKYDRIENRISNDCIKLLIDKICLEGLLTKQDLDFHVSLKRKNVVKRCQKVIEIINVRE